MVFRSSELKDRRYDVLGKCGPLIKFRPSFSNLTFVVKMLSRMHWDA
jgi:hypothetical protein